MSAPVDFILYTERMVGEDSPDYDDTLNRALKTVINLSGADEDDFVGFALRPSVAPSVGQFYIATDVDVGASWQTLVTSMITDLATAATGITKLGTVNTGVWQGTSIATTYTDAKVKTVTGTANRLTIGGTATDPTFDISSSYAGQATITTLGTIVTGVWTGTSIGTAYTDAKVVSITGTSNRLTVAGTATVPILDISAAYVGQTSIVTLGTVTTGSWTATSIATTYTDAKVVSITGTSSRVTVGGTATVPIIDISASYVGQSSITTLGTITTGVWHGTSIDTAYTDAKIKTVTGTSNRLSIGGTSTDPTFDISVSYVGQATITTLGTVTVGTWTGTSISTTYTDAKIASVTGTANRLTIGGTATAPTFDISVAYVGQSTITTLGTVATGTWAATVVGVPYGGTGLSTYTIGDIVYASGATTLSKLGIGTAAQILVTNGGATAPAWHTLVTADITDLTSATTGITKVGTVTTGVWNAGIISGIYGGTGVNNGSATITLAGNLVTAGAFALTLTTTNTTNVTLPTSGTLVNTAVTSLASLTSVGGAFAISGAFTGATTGVFSSTVTASGLILSAAASRVIPGATSYSVRDNANANDNWIILDAGSATLRGALAIGGALSGVTTLATSSTINSQTISATAAFTGTLSAVTSFAVAATSKIYLDGVSGTGDTYLQEDAGNRIAFTAGGTLAFYINATSVIVPALNKLFVDGGGDTYLIESAANVMKLFAGNVSQLELNAVGGYATFAGSVRIPTNTALFFDGGSDSYIYEVVGNLIRIVAGGAGNFDVGQTAVSAYVHLDITHTTSGANTAALAAGSVDATYVGNVFTTSATKAAGSTFNHWVAYSSTSTPCLVVRGDGNVTNTNNSYGAISDARLKDEVLGASSQFDDIRALRFVNYRFHSAVDRDGRIVPLARKSHRQLGLIAQEVNAVCPGLVSEDANGFLTVQYSILSLKIAKAVQELIAIVDDHGPRIAKLEAALT